jgi:hypothetical protein
MSPTNTVGCPFKKILLAAFLYKYKNKKYLSRHALD